jgi:hypothetical protein
MMKALRPERKDGARTRPIKTRGKGRVVVIAKSRVPTAYRPVSILLTRMFGGRASG